LFSATGKCIDMMTKVVAAALNQCIAKQPAHQPVPFNLSTPLPVPAGGGVAAFRGLRAQRVRDATGRYGPGAGNRQAKSEDTEGALLVLIEKWSEEASADPITQISSIA